MVRKLKKFNRYVEDVFPIKPGLVSGEVGIEIEVEGTQLPQTLTSYWSVHREPSLRGESAEYVLAKPVTRGIVKNVLTYLMKKLKLSGSTIHESQRTAVHVHINTQGMTVKQVYNFVCLYLIFEDMFAQFSGENRIGNVFCLRMKEAEEFLDMLVQCVEKDDFRAFTSTNTYRYSAVNVMSLPKYNSIEFRALRGTVDIDVILSWTSLLLALKDAAIDFANPQDIVLQFSELGVSRFFEKIFPAKLREKFGLDPREFTEGLWESLWLVQRIAYASAWEIEPPTKAPRMFKAQLNFGDR